MTELLRQVPAKLLCCAVLAVLFSAALTLLLGWHAIRRLAGIPRVPRPPETYVALSTTWLLLVATGLVAIGAIVLLRDHRRVDGRTELAEVRCRAAGPDRVRMEVRASPSAAPESYDLEGNACVVWVKQVELRPGLAILGVPAVSRIDGIGPVPRPNANPEWLTPRPVPGRRLLDLVVRRTESVPVTVPVDAERSQVVLSSLGGGPTLKPSPAEQLGQDGASRHFNELGAVSARRAPP